MNRYRIDFFLSLIKLASKKNDIEALRGILEFKYPGDRRIPGFAAQYYEKFIKDKNIPTPLTEEVLPQPLPDTPEEFLNILKATETIKTKTKKEEYAESLKSKYPNIDLRNLNQDYLSWLHQRYVENYKKSGEIVHPIEEALETLKSFSSIQDKYKVSAEFREKVREAGYEDISSIQELTLDEMESIISLDVSGFSVKVEGVKIKPEEFLGKFGEWNLWIPHTKETSAKIAGYDEVYNPKTTWCTARTSGSNLFYNYIGRGDIPTFLFYIIKDNPKNDEDWLSLGYVSQGYRLVPDFSGRGGGLSVDRANNGLRESDFSKILGNTWNSIKSRMETELEKHKIVEGGKEKYISPARSLIKSLAKNVEEFKKELGPKSNEEKKDFINVIMNSDPSDEVLDTCGKTLAKIDPKYFLDHYLEEPWAKPYIDSAAKSYAEKDPENFLRYFSGEPWAEPYLDLAASKYAEKNPYIFLRNYSEKPWAKPYIDSAASILVEMDPENFLVLYSEKPWVKPYIELAASNLAERNPVSFLKRYLEKPWVKPHHIEIAKSKLKAKESSNSIQNKLLKLSNFLKSNNLKEYYEINIITNLYKI